MLASWMGAPNTLILGGVLYLLASVWYFGWLPEIRRVIRPVYIENGNRPGPAAAIEAEQR